MLSRFSVKKPYIVTVAVIIILILGGVSLTKMKTDLLPDMDLPYLAVITTTLALALKRWNPKLPMYWKARFRR